MHTDVLEPDTGVTCDLVMHIQHCVSQVILTRICAATMCLPLAMMS